MAKQQKSLQKLTDSSEPTNLYELIEQIEKSNPPLPEGATLREKQVRSDAFVNGLLASPLTSDEYKEDLRNQTWQNNHHELTRIIGKLTGEMGRMPTGNMIAEASGLSRQTINSHLKEFYRSARYQDQLNQFRMLSDRLLAKLYTLAMEGDVRAARVYLDAVGGVPTSDTKPAATNANYIQVNNNIKIDQVTFTKLPESVQQQIASLFLQGLQSEISTHPDKDAAV